MAEAVLIPMVLYDGECEVDAGSINIHHTFNFKQFQKTLKDTIGMSHNNVITTYLVESNRSKSPSKRRKVLITGNVNGGGSRALCKDCTKAEKLGSEAPFHLCVCDEVVAGVFRSTAGPISRRR